MPTALVGIPARFNAALTTGGIGLAMTPEAKHMVIRQRNRLLTLHFIEMRATKNYSVRKNAYQLINPGDSFNSLSADEEKGVSNMAG
ncbi:MAG TPA: hypothetical protein VIF82_13710 [Burkholderiaceae bacterium]|jgi:hypothetical protein